MKYIAMTVMFLCFSVLTACITVETSDPMLDKDIVEPAEPAEPAEPGAFPQSIVLNWNPNPELEDGSTLHSSEIDSYIINWGRSSSNQSEKISVLSPNIGSYIFTVTEGGDYYFSVSVITIYGTKSSLSNLVHKEVN